MSAPLWGHKPAAVANREDYWGDAPPEPSARCVYWVRRWREGSWKPNRWLLRECPDCRAGMLGIWLWEARFVLFPLEQVLVDDRPVAEAAELAMEWSNQPLGPYWALLEERSRPDGVTGDQVAVLAAAMQAARRRPVSALDRLRGRR